MPDPIYLHGFASSPNSKKARILIERFASRGIALEVPFLAPRGLSHLTLTGMLEVVDRAVAGREVSLMGSSLGGYLAALYASRHPSVGKLVLLAPAFGFARLWCDSLGEEKVSAWRSAGVMDVTDYSTGAPVPLGWELIEDALRYADEPEFRQPCLIYHGRQDDVVPIEVSRTFSRTRTNVELRELNSGHDLLDVVDEIWDGMRAFL